MPVTVTSFFPADTAPPLSDDALKAALATARGLAPKGSRIEVRALDRTYLDMDIPLGGAPIVKINDGDMPAPISPAAVTVWFDEAIDNMELKAQQTAKAVHEALGARSTVTFDTRCHLDLTGGNMPKLQALIVVHRRPDLDRDQHIQHYRTRHVPLAKSLGPRFTRYTTNRVLEVIGDFTGDHITFQEYPSYGDLVTHLNTRVQKSDTAHNDQGNYNRHVTYNIGERTFS